MWEHACLLSLSFRHWCSIQVAACLLLFYEQHEHWWMGHCTRKKQALLTVQWTGRCEFESRDRCDGFFNNVTNQEREWSLWQDHYDIVEPNQHHRSMLLRIYSFTILAFKCSSCLEFHLPELTFWISSYIYPLMFSFWFHRMGPWGFSPDFRFSAENTTLSMCLNLVIPFPDIRHGPIHASPHSVWVADSPGPFLLESSPTGAAP